MTASPAMPGLIAAFAGPAVACAILMFPACVLLRRAGRLLTLDKGRLVALASSPPAQVAA